MRVCVCVSVHVCACMHMHVCMLVCARVCVCVCVFMCARVHCIPHQVLIKQITVTLITGRKCCPEPRLYTDC